MNLVALTYYVLYSEYYSMTDMTNLHNHYINTYIYIYMYIYYLTNIIKVNLSKLSAVVSTRQHTISVQLSMHKLLCTNSLLTYTTTTPTTTTSTATNTAMQCNSSNQEFILQHSIGKRISRL